MQAQKYRALYKFEYFNPVQSECMDLLLRSEKDVVISAPTGAGKTVLMELAILNLLMRQGRDPFKAIYLSPTKALCSEKFHDWKVKFKPIGLRCNRVVI